jgi:hypothetical protein
MEPASNAGIENQPAIAGNVDFAIDHNIGDNWRFSDKQAK